MEVEASYYPRLWEGIILLLTALELIAAGSIVKRHWSRSNDALPIPLAALMWLIMAGLYFTMAAAFYQTTSFDHKFTILMYCLLFWTAPLIYFTLSLQHAIALRTIDRIGPFSTRIDDPSEFAAARKLALRGDIDGAVARYREYQDNQANALFEAARLLKAEDRFEDAAAIYLEVAERFYGRRRVWAEAAHNLAKLYEVALGDHVRAASYYREILSRAPETRFGQLAGADLGRMQVLEGSVAEEDEDVSVPAPASPDPFYRRRGSEETTGSPVMETPAEADAGPATDPIPPEGEGDPTEAVVPPEDPFFRLRMARAAALQQSESEDNHRNDASAASKRRAKKKPAAKKKTGAVRKRKP